MLNSTQIFQDELITLTKPRDIYGKIEFRQFDVLARGDDTVTSSSTESISNPNLVVDEVEGVEKNYASWETGRWTLGGKFNLLPSSNYQSMGWWSATLSDSSTKLFTPNITLTNTFGTTHSSIGLTILWDTTNNEWAEEFDVVFYDASNNIINTESVTGNILSRWVYETPINDYKKVIITIKKWSIGNRRARIEEILWGVVNEYSKSNEKLISFSVQEEIDPIASRDVPNKLDFSVDNKDSTFDILNPTGFYAYTQENQEINAYLGILTNGEIEYISVGKYFLSDWETNQNSLEAKFTATDILDLLQQKTYYKGLAGSTTLENLAIAVLGDYGLSSDDYELDPVLSSITITNALPICTYKEAIQHIAIVGRCIYGVNRQGKIYIKRVTETPLDYILTKDTMREPTPKITLEPVVKTIGVNIYTPTIAASSTQIAKSTINLNGTANVWVLYDKPASNLSSSISSGSINSATYYTNAAYLNITATGDTTITITGKEITLSTSLNTISTGKLEGITQNVKTQLISTTALAEAVGNWINIETAKRKTLSVNWRTNPCFELGDIIDIETQFDNYTNTRILKQSYNFDGALSGDINVRGG